MARRYHQRRMPREVYLRARRLLYEGYDEALRLLEMVNPRDGSSGQQYLDDLFALIVRLDDAFYGGPQQDVVERMCADAKKQGSKRKRQRAISETN